MREAVVDRLRFFLTRLRELLWIRPLVLCLVSVSGVLAARLAPGIAIDILGRLVRLFSIWIAPPEKEREIELDRVRMPELRQEALRHARWARVRAESVLEFPQDLEKLRRAAAFADPA